MAEEKDFVVVTVSGNDRPGILASLTKILMNGIAMSFHALDSEGSWMLKALDENT